MCRYKCPEEKGNLANGMEEKMVEIIIMSQAGGRGDRQAALWTTHSSLRGKLPAERRGSISTSNIETLPPPPRSLTWFYRRPMALWQCRLEAKKGQINNSRSCKRARYRYFLVIFKWRLHSVSREHRTWCELFPVSKTCTGKCVLARDETPWQR